MPTYNKLVRDKIPEILDKKGIWYEKRVASLEEYAAELIKKLGEEAQEFVTATGDPEELADVIEVVEALKKLPRYSDVEQICLKKREERGGFDERIIVKGEK